MSGSTENRAHWASEKPQKREIVFNLDTAFKMLPLVRQVVADILQNQRQLDKLAPEEERLNKQRRTLNWPERCHRYQVQDELHTVEKNLQEALGELEALGLVLVDAEEG